jgi:DNA-binding IclR family transcriptional regulator
MNSTLQSIDQTHDRYNVPALQRGLQMLSLFRRERRELTGADFSHELGLPRASIFRILQTLEAAGYVERIEDSSRYRLGVAVLRLGFEYIASMEITEHGRPILDALRDSTGYSSHLVVRDAREVVIVAKSVGFAKLFNSIQVGARLPAHATVLGRVLLSSLSEPALDHLFYGVTLKSFTASTPTNLANLKLMVQEVAQRGYGVSQGGFESGISTIVAPVYGGEKRANTGETKREIQAALSITVPSAQISPDELAKLVDFVKIAADQLTARITNNNGSSNATQAANQQAA